MVAVFLASATNWASGQNNKMSLGSPVNRDDAVAHAPSVSFDGKTLLYAAVSPAGTKQWLEAKLLPSGRWSPPVPVNIRLPVAGYVELNGLTLSIDNSTLYFSATLPGGLGDADIWYAQRVGSQWGPPANMGPEINSEASEGFPSLSPGGRELYFTRRRPAKVGQPAACDAILVAHKGYNDKWRRAIELPSAVNAGCETSPRILPDGKTLVFSSNRAGGRGGYDLYKITAADNGTWGPPAPLAFANTRHDEYAGAVSALGDRLYFQGQDEICGVDLPAQEKTRPMQLLKGLVYDEVTRQPVDAKLLLTNLSGKEAQTELSTLKGNYAAALRPSDEYVLEIKLPQYMEQKRRLKAAALYQEMTEDFRMKPRNVAVNYVFKDSATLLPLKVDVKLTSQKTGQAVRVAFDSLKTVYIMRVSLQENYTLVCESPYHELRTSTFRLDSVRSYDPVNVDVLLKKVFFDFAFQATDTRTGEVIPAATILLREKDTGLLYLPNANSSGDNTVELRKDKEYTVEVTADYYKPVQTLFKPAEALRKSPVVHKVPLERAE